MSSSILTAPASALTNVTFQSAAYKAPLLKFGSARDAIAAAAPSPSPSTPIASGYVTSSAPSDEGGMSPAVIGAIGVAALVVGFVAFKRFGGKKSKRA